MPSKTLLIVRIKPVEMELLDSIAKSVENIKSGSVKDVKRYPIGFGVELLKVGVLVDSEDESLPDKVVKEISSIAGVEEAEIEGMTLL
ncbi:MAG: hypothetical protein QXZ13_03180 [Candidatus Diapherotrites archaeon]